MQTVPAKKMLILNILDILKKYTDEEHRLAAKEIGEILEREYSQKVDRKAIKRNLMNLLDFGYDIKYSEKTRITTSGEEEKLYSDWYLNREFTDAELHLLIDSLQSFGHVPKEQCKQIISKLESLSNTFFKTKPVAESASVTAENVPVAAESTPVESGEGEHIIFSARSHLVDDIRSRFGQDVKISDTDADNPLAAGDVIAEVTTDPEAMYRWSLQYGEHIEILEPVELRERIRSTVMEMAGKYMARRVRY